MKDLKLNAGDRIECVEVPGDPDPITQVEWDNGRSLNLSIPPDRFRRVEGEA